MQPYECPHASMTLTHLSFQLTNCPIAIFSIPFFLSKNMIVPSSSKLRNILIKVSTSILQVK